MGTGTNFYCLCCMEEYDESEIDSETGWCYHCLDTLLQTNENDKS